MNRRFGIIRKLFLSYLCLLAPLLLLGFLLTNTLTSRMKNDAQSALQAQLARVAEDFHGRYLSYRDSSIQIYASPELQQYKMRSGPIAIARGIRKLADLNAYDARVSDVFLYYGDGRAYSAKGLAGVQTYFKTTMRCTEVAAQMATNVLAASKEPAILYLPIDKTDTGYLYFHFPVRFYGGPGESTVSVNHCVNITMLEDLLEPLAKEYPASIIVQLPGGDTVTFHAGVQGGVRQVSHSEYEEAARTATTKVSAAVKGIGVGITVSYAPEDLYAGINRMQAITYAATAAVLMLSIVVSFLLSRRHYRQIRSLVRTVTSADRERRATTAKGGFNELEYIQRMLQRLIDEGDRMESRAAQTREALRSQAATLLFHGLIKGNDAIGQMLRMCGIERRGNHFAIAGVMRRSAGGAQAPWETVESVFGGGLACRMEIGARQALFALVELSQPDYLRAARTDLAQRALACMGQAGDGVAAVSQVYESLNMASYAYLETASILEEAAQNPEMGGVICWESLAKGKAGTQKLPEKEIQRLEQALQQADEETVLLSFSQLMKTIDEQTMPDKARQSLRLRVLQPVLLALRQRPDLSGDPLLAELLRLDPADRDRFEATMRKLIRRLCHVPEKKDDFERILAFIEDNYSSFDLSLDRVSEYAGLSKTYLSKLFKTKTNCRYIDYLTQLRMREARRLILETDLSVKEIVENVGYLDAAGFRKKFKATFGVNAAELRKSWAGEGVHCREAAPVGGQGA